MNRFDWGKYLAIALAMVFLLNGGGQLLAQEASVGATTQAAESEQEDEFVMIEHPLAIMPFKTRGDEVEGMGEKISDLMFANLVVDPALFLIDREDLNEVLGVAELSLSGLVNPAEATQVGQLTGAKLLVTGSVFEVGDQLYLVAKVIGTETSRVVGASVKGDIWMKLSRNWVWK